MELTYIVTKWAKLCQISGGKQKTRACREGVVIKFDWSYAILLFRKGLKI